MPAAPSARTASARSDVVLQDHGVPEQEIRSAVSDRSDIALAEREPGDASAGCAAAPSCRAMAGRRMARLIHGEGPHPAREAAKITGRRMLASSSGSPPARRGDHPRARQRRLQPRGGGARAARRARLPHPPRPPAAPRAKPDPDRAAVAVLQEEGTAEHPPPAPAGFSAAIRGFFRDLRPRQAGPAPLITRRFRLTGHRPRRGSPAQGLVSPSRSRPASP